MVTLSDQHDFNVNPGPLFEGKDHFAVSSQIDLPVKLIAYYLPQFHSIPVNDLAWGAGFTEWTNATKALPRYVGHYQPRLPADLGFYDLRSIDTLVRQAEMAKRGGIYGFCIHNYWFNGQRVLEKPLDILLANPQIDIRFCLNWANETWSRRWDGSDHDILLAQNYSAEADIAYAESIIPAVMDARYIRVDNRPLIMMYRPGILPDARATVERWREVFVRRGIGDPYVVMSEAFDGDDPRPWGFDATAGFPPHKLFRGGGSLKIRRLDPLFRGAAKSYPALAEAATTAIAKDYPFHPGVCPGWDNEARKPRRGTSFYGSTPAIYGSWLRAAAEYAMQAPLPDHRLVFINAWNEWAEGAYLEPDRHFGYAYLAETARVLASVSGQAEIKRPENYVPHKFQARETPINAWLNRGWTAARRLRSMTDRAEHR